MRDRGTEDMICAHTKLAVLVIGLVWTFVVPILSAKVAERMGHAGEAAHGCLPRIGREGLHRWVRLGAGICSQLLLWGAGG